MKNKIFTFFKVLKMFRVLGTGTIFVPFGLDYPGLPLFSSPTARRDGRLKKTGKQKFSAGRCNAFKNL